MASSAFSSTNEPGYAPEVAGVPSERSPWINGIDAELMLRPATSDDAGECGRIVYEAFHEISTHHRFAPDFPDVVAATGLFDYMLAQPDVYVAVAERDGRIVGSNGLWEQTPIAGVGPITVEPDQQNGDVGRALMLHVLQRAETRDFRGVRLVQAAYHNRSLALYTKLGFDAREPLSVMQGSATGDLFPDRVVRSARETDLEACGKLHEDLHGFSRAGELPSAIAQGTAKVVEREGRISGYATQIGFFGHAVGESNKDIMALIGAAQSYAGPGFLVPTRNPELMRWCLDRGLRIVQPMTLMARGFYREPSGSFLPSVLF